MNIVFVNFHPVDSQVVKHAAKELSGRHKVTFLYSEKEGIVADLISREGFKKQQIGSIKQGFFRRIISTIILEFNLIRYLILNKTHLIFSPSSMYVGIAAKLLGIPYIAWADTEIATVNLKTSFPLIDSLLIPDSFYLDINSKKVIRFNSYKEFAYLHPNRFDYKNNVMESLEVKKKRQNSIITFFST